MYDWISGGEQSSKMDTDLFNCPASDFDFDPASLNTFQPEIKNDPGINQQVTQALESQNLAHFHQSYTLDVESHTRDFDAFIEDIVKPELNAQIAQKAEAESNIPTTFQAPIAAVASNVNGTDTHGAADNGYHDMSQTQVTSVGDQYQENTQGDFSLVTESTVAHASHMTDGTNDMTDSQFAEPLDHQANGHSPDEGQCYAVRECVTTVIEPEGFVPEPLCRLKAFYVGGAWPLGPNPNTVKHRFGQMFVEQMDPPRITQPHAIIFLHGDFHHGKIWQTKPDENPGWAPFFVQKGYQVFTVDLPPSGRANFLTPDHFRVVDIERVSQAITAGSVEHTLTVPESAPTYRNAELHNQWPGTGRRGDPAFDAHCDTLDTLTVPKRERQTLGQHAVVELLKKITRKAIIIGEGAGSNIAWLAADMAPDSVAAVIAVEPTGPPFGKPSRLLNGSYTGSVTREKTVRPYGLADIPLTYDPPARPIPKLNPDMQDVLDVVEVARDGTRAVYFMQDGADTSGRTIIRNALYPSEFKGRVRQLIELKKVPHAVITAEASTHTEFDWATVAFMRQAGLGVDWLKLEEHGIKGNGHLMFLEKNSDKIADLIERWIRYKTQPASVTDKGQEAADVATGAGLSRQARNTAPTVTEDINGMAIQNYHQNMMQSTNEAINGAMSGTIGTANGATNGATHGIVTGVAVQNQHQHEQMATNMNSAVNGSQHQHQYMAQNPNGSINMSSNGVMLQQYTAPNNTGTYQGASGVAHTASQHRFSTPGPNSTQGATFSNRNAMT